MSSAVALRVLPAMVVTFPLGLPGLAGAHRFQLGPLGEGVSPNPFGRLVALDPVRLRGGDTAVGLSLNVTTTGLFWPDLSVDIDDYAESVLELDHAGDAVILAVVTRRDPVERSTANLFAPLVVNPARALGLQFVPNGTEATVGRSIHTPLPLPSSL